MSIQTLTNYFLEYGAFILFGIPAGRREKSGISAERNPEAETKIAGSISSIAAWRGKYEKRIGKDGRADGIVRYGGIFRQYPK